MNCAVLGRPGIKALSKLGTNKPQIIRRPPRGQIIPDGDKTRSLCLMEKI